MKKVRISCDVNLKLRKHVDTQAKEDGISRAQFIADAVQEKVEGVNVHKENKRLTEARRKAELEINALQEKNVRLEQQVANQQETCERLGREKAELTEQRDEFERHLHAEKDAYNKCYERAESLKKERNRFKAQAEETQSKFETCEEKLTLLLARNWWERLWNTLPWKEK